MADSLYKKLAQIKLDNLPLYIEYAMPKIDDAGLEECENLQDQSRQLMKEKERLLELIAKENPVLQDFPTSLDDFQAIMRGLQPMLGNLKIEIGKLLIRAPEAEDMLRELAGLNSEIGPTIRVAPAMMNELQVVLRARKLELSSLSLQGLRAVMQDLLPALHDLQTTLRELLSMTVDNPLAEHPQGIQHFLLPAMSGLVNLMFGLAPMLHDFRFGLHTLLAGLQFDKPAVEPTASFSLSQFLGKMMSMMTWSKPEPEEEIKEESEEEESEEEDDESKEEESAEEKKDKPKGDEPEQKKKDKPKGDEPEPEQ